MKESFISSSAYFLLLHLYWGVQSLAVIEPLVFVDVMLLFVLLGVFLPCLPIFYLIGLVGTVPLLISHSGASGPKAQTVSPHGVIRVTVPVIL